jgi:Restriction endonuclease/Topoisomerase DNA binding C4 zinc finger
VTIARGDIWGWVLLAGYCGWWVIYMAFSTVYDSLSKWRNSWKPCVHGVRGGRGRGLCEQCICDRNIADLEAELKAQIALETGRRNKAADALQHREWLRVNKTFVPRLEELRELTPQGFEDQIAQMFRRLGYEVEQTPYTNDRGRDGLLRKGGELFLYECKRYGDRSSSGRPDLQKFHSAIITDGAKGGLFITTGTFTSEAVEFAASVPIINLIDSTRLLHLLIKSESNRSGDEYETMCRQCGETVCHRLRTPQSQRCPNAHLVGPSLIIGMLLPSSPRLPPPCPKCGKPMRLIRRRTGNFWGCSLYPKCRYTRSVKRSRPSDELVHKSIAALLE